MTTGVTSAVLGDVPMIVATGVLDPQMCATLRQAFGGLVSHPGCCARDDTNPTIHTGSGSFLNHPGVDHKLQFFRYLHN